LEHVRGPFWRDLTERLAHFVTVGSAALGTERLHELHEIITYIEKQHSAIQHTFAELMPWVPLLARRPAAMDEPALRGPLRAMLAELGERPTLAQVRRARRRPGRIFQGCARPCVPLRSRPPWPGWTSSIVHCSAPRAMRRNWWSNSNRRPGAQRRG
jgi:hypothetical protein